MLLHLDLIVTAPVACDFVTTMSFREDKGMPETHPGHLASLATESGSSTSKGSRFVKAIGGKARSFLNSLDRSFSSLITERDDELSSMTIEFLYSQLRAQRTAHRAEKQRVQQLLKKVMELEQKLNLETARRKEAKCRDVSSPKCRCYPLSKDSPRCNETACMMNKGVQEKCIITEISHFEDDSHYATKHKDQHAGCRLLISGIEDQIDEGGAHHMCEHEVSSMVQFCFCHQCEFHRSNCQGSSSQHCSPFDKQFNAPCSKSLMQKENRENMDWGMEFPLHLKELKENIMSEMTQMNLNTKDPYHDLDSWNKTCSITNDHKETTLKGYASLDSKVMPTDLSHTIFCGDLPTTARSFWRHISNSSIESLEVISLDNPKFLSTEAMSPELLQKCSINNHPGDQDEGALEGIMNSPNKIRLGAFTGMLMSSPISGHHIEIQEDRHAARHMCKPELEGRHAMASRDLETVCGHGKGLFYAQQMVH